MKRITALILSMLFLLCSCKSTEINSEETVLSDFLYTSVIEYVQSSEESSTESKTEPISKPQVTSSVKAETKPAESVKENVDEKPKEKYVAIENSGIWLSYYEIADMLSLKNDFDARLKQVIDNCKALKIENVYIHVRAYCDALYKSSYFPLMKKAKAYDYDVFQKMLTAFHNEGIKVHAWINPYRVLTSSSDINAVDKDSPAYKWLNDNSKTNDVNVCFSNGIYLNPAEAEVRKLILDGVREIISKYKVDGIHFDDYFYPTADSKFDEASYSRYLSEVSSPLSLGDWRRENVNALISGCYSAIKSYNKNIVFSVSPAASIEKNYNNYYADVEKWAQGGYLDVLIPQLYFGFEHTDENYRFEKLLDDWYEICANTDTKLLIGLAPYKIGLSNKADGDEWSKKSDILSRQVKLCYDEKKADGYVLFSYSSLFLNKELNLMQKENLLKYINSISAVTN